MREEMCVCVCVFVVGGASTGVGAIAIATKDGCHCFSADVHEIAW